MVAKSGLIPLSPYPPVLTLGWCLDESGGMTMEMEMDFGEGGRGFPAKKEAGAPQSLWQRGRLV